MAVLEKYSYPNQEFYDWRVANLGGFSFIFDTLTERATEIMPLQGSETK